MRRSISVIPSEFTLVPFDAAEIAGLLGAVADELEFADIDIALVVDEELFAPLVGTAADVVDGRVQLWISGANLEDKRRPRCFDSAAAGPDFAAMLLRAADRLTPEFEAAPSEAELRRDARAAWDVWAVGRAHRRGYPAREQARRYEFRLQHGFSDVADEAFDELWGAGDAAYDWQGLLDICERTGADERDGGAVPIDLLRQQATG